MKKSFTILIGIFCLIWYFNYCTPLIFDDYVYSYICNIDAMGVPFSDNANRVSSLFDVFYSQYLHYFNWGGRSVAHSLAQFFLWQGKDIFNIANAGCFILLLLEIQWLINNGKVQFRFLYSDILWIFGVFWLSSFFMGDVFTWLTLSCNYLWTTTIMLALLLMYERHYFYADSDVFTKNNFVMFVCAFFLGITAGWTNENVPCFVGLVLAFYVLKIYKAKRGCTLLLWGLIGLLCGYLLLMSAPGNYVRYVRQLQDGIIVSGLPVLKDNLIILSRVLFFRVFLLYYVISRLFMLNNKNLNENEIKAYYVSAAFFVVSIASTVIMIFSPFFRFRSSFPGLVFLIISAGILRRIVKNSNAGSELSDLSRRCRKLIYVTGSAYVVFTLISQICICELLRQHTKNVLAQIHQYKISGTEDVLTVRERPLFMDQNLFPIMMITGGHAVYPITITKDKDCWINKDVALYYGIKAIQSAKVEDIK